MTEQTIFLAALEITDPAERLAYLDRATAGDETLRRQIESLLAAHERSGAFLDVPACEQMAARPSAPGQGTAAVEANPPGVESVAAHQDRQDRPATQAGQQGDEEEMTLDFLQPSTKPGALGRLGHYEVLEVLGRGGFGIVVRAFDERLHRVVAIKVMAPRLASAAASRKRFLREARSAAAIRHENIVSIHAVEEQPIPFLVMEYIAGQTLQQKLDRVGPLDVPEVLRLGHQIARGLAAAHALGLIHRDIKPANILLENGVDRVKITDFGLARAADDAHLTESGVIAGTPLYMAPEQAQGEAIDHRADLFSLGSVLYALCTGRPPFRAATTMAVLKRVVEDTPRPIREIFPEVPERLCAVVTRLHAKKPADRFASAQEVADLLGRYLAEVQQQGSAGPLCTESATAPASLARRDGRQRLGRPGSRTLALVGGLALVTVLVLAGYLLMQRFRPQVDPHAPVGFHALANQVWQDTGVDAVEGEAIVLAPKGSWRKGEQTCSAGGLDRAPRERAVWPEAPLMCLLVRIGDESTPMAVRQREVIKPRRSGRLFVQANDLDLDGNSDGLQLTIMGGQRLGDAAPLPEWLPIQAAERDWKPLLARIEAPGARADQLRDEVFDYCQRYAGTPHSFRAGQRLLKAPPLVNSIGMKLVPIPAGKFLMGSPVHESWREPYEGPQHEVVITRPFFMGVYDVTVGQFRVFVQAKGYRTDADMYGGADSLFPDGWKNVPQANWQRPGFEQTDDHPVVSVSWNDAVAFCKWLSQKEGKNYALPTEAQWEYSCRAGSQTRFYFGNDDEELIQYAWCDRNAERKTHPVGQKKPNAWGLYDMSGNVWQWTADWYDADYYRKSPREDPLGPTTGDNRVLRGGGWSNPDLVCRAATRFGFCKPPSRGSVFGFRVVLLP
jgi:formylglycine-generating enzyme required for sulfatase activity